MLGWDAWLSKMKCQMRRWDAEWVLLQRSPWSKWGGPESRWGELAVLRSHPLRFSNRGFSLISRERQEVLPNRRSLNISTRCGPPSLAADGMI